MVAAAGGRRGSPSWRLQVYCERMSLRRLQLGSSPDDASARSEANGASEGGEFLRANVRRGERVGTLMDAAAAVTMSRPDRGRVAFVLVQDDGGGGAVVRARVLDASDPCDAAFFVHCQRKRVAAFILQSDDDDDDDAPWDDHLRRKGIHRKLVDLAQLRHRDGGV